MPNGEMSPGSSTDQYVPTMPISDMMMYCGMASVIPGSSTPARIR